MKSCTIVYWLRTYEYGVDPVLEWHKGMLPNINKVSYTEDDNELGKLTFGKAEEVHSSDG